MAQPKLFGKNLQQFADMDIDELLSQLTEEEIEELNNEIDPDDSLLPPSERCKNQTNKEPTGVFDREKLMDYLEKKALAEPDWEQNAAFEHKIRGKVFVPKEPPKTAAVDDDLETEYDDILANAPEEELVALAAILGFTGMMNQVQYNAALDNKDSVTGGFSGVAKYTASKLVPNEPPNDTDIEDVTKKLNANDPELTSINLNNIKNISDERFVSMFDAMKSNSHIKSISMANTQAKDCIVKSLIDVLKENKSLTTVNIESNFVTGQMIVQLMEAINENKTVTEFRASNQRQSVLGVKVEMELTALVEANDTILAVGVDFQTKHARIRVNEHLSRNGDKQLRQKRVGNAAVNGEA